MTKHLIWMRHCTQIAMHRQEVGLTCATWQTIPAVLRSRLFLLLQLLWQNSEREEGLWSGLHFGNGAAWKDLWRHFLPSVQVSVSNYGGSSLELQGSINPTQTEEKAKLCHMHSTSMEVGLIPWWSPTGHFSVNVHWSLSFAKVSMTWLRITM